MNIEILSSDKLKAVLVKQTTGIMAETYSCNIEWSDGSVTRSYVKRFVPARNLAIVNEITGYILADGCSLPIPKHVGLINAPGSIFNDESNAYSEICIAVSEVSGTNPVSYYNLGELVKCKELMNMVAGWDKISDALAFDDWVANEDRHLGNIMVSGKGEINLIDHSNLPIDINWSAKQLDPNYLAKSVLAQNLWALNCMPFPVRSKIAKQANSHSSVYTNKQQVLTKWWNTLLKDDPARRQALETFIETRAQKGNARVSANMNILAV
ncbi:hypothetical protein NDJ12_22290 [Vibrio alginolyticus]|uniref:hypothetical protein n=1 Tax=Vibrio alginolyticus TaxID=663 RepID=UPI00215F9D4E|nr:hypothetical protein [Vibrio alginolyticus]MCS0216636.1 hypothetical protein [Vibrio alginolyticus]